jgi:hypothetical protein
MLYSFKMGVGALQKGNPAEKMLVSWGQTVGCSMGTQHEKDIAMKATPRRLGLLHQPQPLKKHHQQLLPCTPRPKVAATQGAFFKTLSC